MKWMGLNELRETFLSFFEGKDHLRLESFSLVPQNDKSLLLINSGMAPMKKYFTGEITPPKNRVTTCQKCVRTPDLESVGITARHGTFFEMLGNFSFGDYFKKEAIKWAWEFCIEVIELPVGKIWVSVYEEDDEALKFWNEEIGIPLERIVKLGKEDNFWEHGKGPCGPCSELYFDKGEKFSCGSKNCKPGCDCDRYIEFWNLVFTEFQNNGENKYTKLESKNIDTGMGLERLACIMQNVDNIFLIDAVNEILQSVCALADKTYGKSKTDDVSIRIITDHIRSIVFMVADGIIPSNEGRGYVLRKLLRRAVVHARLLGITDLLLHKISTVVINQNKEAYPYLNEKSEYIEKIIKTEETAFGVTVNNGMSILKDMMKNAKNNTLSGEDAFKLTDTFGFPVDLAKEILAKYKIKIDLEKYEELLQNQKNMAKIATKRNETGAWENIKASDFETLKNTEFVGYSELESMAEVLRAIPFDEKCKDTTVLAVDKTPFYAESGGQVGDIGTIECSVGIFDVINTKKTKNGVFLHTVKAPFETFNTGDKVKLCIDKKSRESIKRNHTGAHLLQSALKLVLGEHVHQAGQLVDANRIRFDFEHFKAISPLELENIENIINEKIFEHLPVNISEMSLADATKSGATALFTEKYGEFVRVVDVSGFSKELCGGTHVENTSNLGIFKILSEGSVSSGVRRIEAVTGVNTLNYFKSLEKNIDECVNLLGGKPGSNLSDVCNRVCSELRKKEGEIKLLSSEITNIKLNEISKAGKNVNNVFTSFNVFSDLSPDIFKNFCDKVKLQHKDFLIILVNKLKDKNNIAVLVSDSLNTKNIFANDILNKILDKSGGKGGGRKNFAMGNVQNLEVFTEVAQKIINSALENI